MATSMNGETAIACDDFLQFQEALKKMRLIDDRIVHALNTSMPTDSFARNVDAAAQCKHLYGELSVVSSQREGIIKHCILEVSGIVKRLKEQRDVDSDNVKLLLNLRKEQTKLRLIQAELNVEEVVKDRTLKTFHERCRNHYLPPGGGHF
ncbi:hypothetical protein ScPMuIL_013224 [Solemya velum]